MKHVILMYLVIRKFIYLVI